MVTVFHDGIHICLARELFEISEEVKEKISSGGTTITKLTEDTIIDCLKEENPCWNDVFRIANSILEQEKLYYAKQKANAKSFFHGHSLEVVALLDLNSLERIHSFYFDWQSGHEWQTNFGF